MTRDEAMMVFRDAISAGQALAPFAGEEAAATVIQQAFAERDGEIDRLRGELAELRANSIRFAGGSPLTVGGGSISSRTVYSVSEALAAKGDSRG